MEKTQNTLIFDVESTSLPEAERNVFRPEFEAPGNFRDPKKIAAAIATKEAEWVERAALSSLTGKILCVGCWTQAKEFFVLESSLEPKIGFDSNEADVIQSTFDLLQHTIQSGGQVVGFCCKTFDLPFLVQRAWRLGLYVPQCLRNGKWWAEEIIDLAEVWNGPGSHERISLDHLAKALGVGAKNGDGKDFGALWEANKTAALDYVRNDCQLIRLCAERMLPQ